MGMRHVASMCGYVSQRALFSSSLLSLHFFLLLLDCSLFSRILISCCFFAFVLKAMAAPPTWTSIPRRDFTSSTYATGCGSVRCECCVDHDSDTEQTYCFVEVACSSTLFPSAALEEIRERAKEMIGQLVGDVNERVRLVKS